jgi:hypothetical protein
MAEFLRDTSAALGLELEPTRMLELEAADALGALASVAVHAARVVVDTGGAPVPFAWRESQVPTLEALLREIAGRLPLIRAVYLPAEASLVGGVWLAPQELLPAALTLVRDREWVEFCGPACSDGLLLEYDASGAEHGVERPYELVVWGAEWAPRAEEACAALGIARV